MRLLHYSNAQLSEIRSVKQADNWLFKPRGLWVSVEGKDDWASWCRAEDFRLGSIAHEVELSPSANILRITDADGIDNLTDEFEPSGSLSSWWLDWQAIAARWQGIIIAPYIWERRLHDRASWYYPWDCASGCIWDASAVKSIKLLEATP